MLKKKPILIAPLGLISLTVLSGAFLISSYSYATDDNTIDNVSVNVPVSCTMSGTGMNSHNASIPNGTYQADIGTTTLKAFCNDSSGFAIYAIGFSNEEYGNTNLIGTGANQTISTGTAISGNTSNWAMKLATDSTATFPLTIDNSFGSYSAVPTSYTKVAHRDAGTDTGSSAAGASLTSTYAAYISKTQNADTYNGKVKYTLVHPANETPAQPVSCPAGKICYNANSSSVVGQMGKQAILNNASAILWASNFKRNGYGFAGWNDAFDYSGNYYGPNETITAPSDVETNGLSLYAVWIKSAGSLQNWDGCGSLAQGTTTALTDERDGNTYAVAKLADGKCWMIENLRLADKDSSDNDIELSSINTHSPSLPLTNAWWFSTDNDSDTKPTSNHLSATTDPTSAAWCQTHSSNCDDQSMLATNNTVLFTDNGTTYSYRADLDVYSFGNYYNWYSATAGHGKYGDDYGESYNAPGDICPAGWHLPKGGDKTQEATNEFWQLIVTGLNNGVNPANYSNILEPYYSGSTEAESVWNALRTYPNNFVNSGYLRNSSIDSRHYRGYYWSTSGTNISYAYSMSFMSDSVVPGGYYNGKNYGWAIRCIADI